MSARGLPAFAGRPVGQVGIVVRDLDEALDHYVNVLGATPWRCWTYGPRTVPDLGYRGAPGDYEMRIALWGEAPQLELIEPVRGPSIYHEWLERHGPGLHHMAVNVQSMEEALAEMAEAGREPVQWGRGYGVNGDGGFAYFDTVEEFGYYLELVEVPSVRIEPERIVAA